MGKDALDGGFPYRSDDDERTSEGGEEYVKDEGEGEEGRGRRTTTTTTAPTAMRTTMTVVNCGCDSMWARTSTAWKPIARKIYRSRRGPSFTFSWYMPVSPSRTMGTILGIVLQVCDNTIGHFRRVCQFWYHKDNGSLKSRIAFEKVLKGAGGSSAAAAELAVSSSLSEVGTWRYTIVIERNRPIFLHLPA